MKYIPKRPILLHPEFWGIERSRVTQIHYAMHENERTTNRKNSYKKICASLKLYKQCDKLEARIKMYIYICLVHVTSAQDWGNIEEFVPFHWYRAYWFLFWIKSSIVGIWFLIYKIYVILFCKIDCFWH